MPVALALCLRVAACLSGLPACPILRFPSHMCWLPQADRLMSLSRQAAARVCCVASVAGATTVRALCQGRAPSWDRMSAAVAEADTAVRLRLADELKRLRW